MKHMFALVCILAVATGCTLPRSGPVHGKMTRLENNPTDAFEYVSGVDYVRSDKNVPVDVAISAAWKLSPYDSDVITAGDILAVQVIENVAEGVFASMGNRIFVQSDIIVPQSGFIFLPYAGKIQASGKTSEQLRTEIVKKLENQTPDPQVSVFRAAGKGVGVTVIGDIASQGVKPLEPGNLSLLSMIAASGGTTIPVDSAMISVKRRGAIIELRLSEILSSAGNDLVLRPGDLITVYGNNRFITVLGAAGSQSRVPVTSIEFKLVDLLATVGGLEGRSANPRGIFVMRASDSESEQPETVVHFDISSPEGLSAARLFNMRANDTVYITEAPIQDVRKALDAIIGIGQSANAVGGSL